MVAFVGAVSLLGFFLVESTAAADEEATPSPETVSSAPAPDTVTAPDPATTPDEGVTATGPAPPSAGAATPDAVAPTADAPVAADPAPAGDEPPAAEPAPDVPAEPTAVSAPAEPGEVSPAKAVTPPPTPDTAGHSTTFIQEVESITWNAGTSRWDVVLKATLDSNVTCHVILLQCVVQETSGDLTLVGQTCPPNWTIEPFMNWCTRFDHHNAGTDKEFHYLMRSAPNATGIVTAEAKFFRWPFSPWPIATAPVSINLDAPVHVVKDAPDQILAGTDDMVYTIVVSDPGLLTPATNVVLADMLPAGMTYVSNDAGCNESGGLVTCQIGTLVPGGSFTVHVTVNVGAGLDGDVVNTAEVTWDNEGAAKASATTRVFQPTDTIVLIDKNGPDTVTPGAPIVYTITITNVGVNAANDVVVTDKVPAYILSPVMTRTSGAGTWICDGLTCTSVSFPAGATAVFTVTGTVDPATPNGTVLLNDAVVVWSNDVVGPERHEVLTQVVVAPATPESPTTPTETATVTEASVLPFTGGSWGVLALCGLLVAALGLCLNRLGRRLA